MHHEVTEPQIIPIKPHDGLVAFASVVLDRDLYLGGIGIYTRPEGGYRLAYPTRKSGNNSFPVYHPISKQFTDLLTEVVVSKYEEVTKTYDRYNNPDSRE